MQIRVSAEDNVGNQVEEIVGSIELDERAPYVALDTRTVTDTYSTTVTFSGTAIEQPNWYGKVLEMHLEDDLLDSSGRMHDGTCTSCPTYLNGVFGRAASFEGSDVVSAEIDNITETVTLAGWLYMADLGDTDLIDLGNGKATLGMLSDQSLIAQLTTISNTYTITSSASVLRGESWYHIALTWDGATMTAYLDGVTIGSQATEGTLIDGTAVTLGDTDTTVWMDLDEVQIYHKALSAGQIFGLATDNVAGVASVEYMLEQVFTDERQTNTWQSATLDAAGDSLAQWSADVSAEGEGFYQLRLRGSDANNNESGDYVAWRGQIDTLAPRVTMEAAYVGTDAAAQTKYVYMVEDLLLDLDLLNAPCSSNDLVYTDTVSIDSVSAECYVDGHPSSTTLAVCDEAGNCTSAEFTPVDETSNPHTTIEAEDQIIQEGERVQLSGIASAENGLRYLGLRVGNTEIYSKTFDVRTPTDTFAWSFEWEPPTDGEFEVNVYIQDQIDQETTRPMYVTVESGLITAVELSSLQTTTVSLPLSIVSLLGLTLLLIIRRRWLMQNRPKATAK